MSWERASETDDIGTKLRKSHFAGQVILPEDGEFNAARSVFYRSVDKRPAVIVRAANDEDVSRAIRFAREHDLELAVRSGGHSVVGHGVCEGGIVLDLSLMQHLEIDPASRTAWTQTGATTGQYTRATAAHGLCTGFGDSGTVGIGGITLGGGIGYLVRKFGLTIDDLLAAEVVTAEGEWLRTDSDTHPDLFWAIRGGGGNFGVATRFQFRLHEVDRVFGGMLLLPATPDAVRSFVAEAESAPEELSIIANILPAPPMPFIPTDQVGRLTIIAMMVYAGPIEAGQRAVSPFRSLGTPVADMLRPMRYQEMYDVEGPHPSRVSFRSFFLDTVDQAAAETITGYLRASQSEMPVTQIRVLGGAMARVPVDATAFAHRNRRVFVSVVSMYEDGEEAEMHDAWASGFAGALHKGDDGVYVNFLGNEGESRIRAAYPGATWDRLVSVKRRYDPDNLFRLNQNIPPGGR